MFELAHTAFVAQRKIKGQLASGVMESSRSEYNDLIAVFENAECPGNMSANSWANDFLLLQGKQILRIG